MKIAAYGDSFAADYMGWPQYIAEHYSATLDIYGIGGTSIEFTYLNFIKTEKEYDKVLVFWSSPDRTSLICQNFDTKEYTHYGECQRHQEPKGALDYNTHFPVAKSWCGKNKDWIFYRDKKDARKIRALLSQWINKEIVTYKTELLFGNRHALKHDAMRESVLYRRPDAAVVECFGPNGMMNIQIEDFENMFGSDQLSWTKVYTEDPETRLNHMSAKQNEEFAKYLIRHMEDPNFDIHTTFDFNVLKDYYTMSKTIEEAGLVKK